MIAHLEYVSDNRIHVRVFDVDAPIEYAETLFNRKEPYQGSMVITLKPKFAFVELATGMLGFKVYKQLRDYLFEAVKVKEIRWDGNGRVQKPKRRKDSKIEKR